MENKYQISHLVHLDKPKVLKWAWLTRSEKLQKSLYISEASIIIYKRITCKLKDTRIYEEEMNDKNDEFFFNKYVFQSKEKL